MSSLKKNISIALLIGLIASIITYQITRPVKNRDIVSVSDNIVPLWAKTGVFIPVVKSPDWLYSNKRFLIQSGDDLLLFGRNNFEYNYRLTSLDLQSGAINWELALPINPYSSAIDVNEEFVFVASVISDASESSPGTIRVVAYQIDDGKEAWRNTYEAMALIDTIRAGEDHIYITGGGGHSSIERKAIIDARNGEWLPVRTKTNIGILKHIYRDYLYDLGRDKAVSNVIKHEDMYFFVSPELRLEVWNKERDEIVGYVELEGAPPEPRRCMCVQYPLLVTDKYIIVYLFDSRQLFVFEFALPTSDK